MDDKNEPQVVETYAERDSRMGGLVFVALIISGVVAAIAYQLFGTSLAGWIGAGIGIGLAMMIGAIREAIIYAVLAIGLFFLIIAAGFFILSTFSDSGDSVETTSKTEAQQKRILPT